MMETEELPSSPTSGSPAQKSGVPPETKKRGWKFDNPCLMCKKGTSKIVGNAEVPCTCGGKPAKKRSITAEAFNPFALPSAPAFVPPTKVIDQDPAPEPLVVDEPPSPQVVIHVPRQPALPQQMGLGYHSANQRPLTHFARPIPPQQPMIRPQQMPMQQIPMQQVFQQPTRQEPINFQTTILQPQQLPLQTQQIPMQQPQQIPMQQMPMQQIPMQQPQLQPQPQPQQYAQGSFLSQQSAGRMGVVLHNILDEMKQLSALTQQLKEEHNTFVKQVERLKRKNNDMQRLIAVGTEPLAAFAQVNRGDNDLTSADVFALLREIPNTPTDSQGTTQAAPVDVYSHLVTPFVGADASKPFMVFRPANLDLTAKEVSLLCDQKKMSKTAKDKLRVNRIAVSDAFCKLVNYERDDLLQTKDPRKIFRSKHKKHFYLPVASFLLKPSQALVSPILPFEPRFRTKDGTILFTSSKMQVFYNEMGRVSFFFVCVESVTRTHVPGYLQARQRQYKKTGASFPLLKSSALQPHQAQHRPQQAPLFKLMKLGVNNNMGFQQRQQQQQPQQQQEEVDDVFRNDEDELDEEEEAFLNGASYYLPQYRAQPSSSSSSSSASSFGVGSYDSFDSPVGSPVYAQAPPPHSATSVTFLPASPVGAGGYGAASISVGTLKEFEDPSVAEEDYSWLLNQNTPDSFSLAF